MKTPKKSECFKDFTGLFIYLGLSLSVCSIRQVNNYTACAMDN